MSKMHYFSNKISKIAKRWEISSLSFKIRFQNNFRYWWPEVAWFGQTVAHWLWRNGTSKRHQNNVTKFFHFGPLPNQNFRLHACAQQSAKSGSSRKRCSKNRK